MAATGTMPLLKMGGVLVLANGDATFAGTVAAESIVAAEQFTAPEAQFTGAVTAGGVVDSDMGLQSLNGYVLVEEVLTDTVSMSPMAGFEGSQQWHLQNRDSLYLVHGVTDRYRFESSGQLYADGGYNTFSPVPPKPAEDMTARDWLVWACEDASKPHKPYEGLPVPDNPAVVEEAKRRGLPAEEVAASEREAYGKNISQIAIGTARALEMIFEAAREATDFAEFQRRLIA